ncbi:hypothetical protein V2G26_004646 [Clonostachys chloroleuca]
MKTPSTSVFACPLGSSIGAIGDHCTYPVEGATYNGICRRRANCANDGKWYVDNRCPNDIADVKCCIQTACTVGICSNTEQGYCARLGGVFKRGLCPGPSDVQCCTFSRENRAGGP